jgi:hypothetical protein
MKKSTRLKPHEWGLIALAVLASLSGLIGHQVMGQAGWGFSWKGVAWPYEYTHNIDCDSGYAVFGYPTAANFYDTVTISPLDIDSTLLRSDSLLLDSVGDHIVRIVYYERDALTPDSMDGGWFNGVDFGRVTPPPNGTANICRMYGYLSDVGITGIKRVRVTATLPSDTYDSCSETIIFDRDKAVWSYGSNGYFQIDLVYSSCLGDEKYTFTFEKRHFETFEHTLTVPDSATHYIRWDD